MKPRLVFIPGFLLFHPGCSFFGVEHSDCLPNEDCSAAVGDGDGDMGGDGDVGGDGDGDLTSSGGAVGDGDGDVGTGGGDGDLATGGNDMGGAGDGGDRGSGGMPTGGTGGAPDGGTGGMPAGGTGGAPDGGTGGMPSGGAGGMGAGGLAQIAREIQINEIHPQFVEVYFLAYEETSLNLDSFQIVVDGKAGQACKLTGGVVDESNRYFLIQRPNMTCLGPSACVVGCLFDTIGTAVEVELQVLIDEAYYRVDAEFSSPTELSGNDSYQAIPDGVGDFTQSAQTAGITNE